MAFGITVNTTEGSVNVATTSFDGVFETGRYTKAITANGVTYQNAPNFDESSGFFYAVFSDSTATGYNTELVWESSNSRFKITVSGKPSGTTYCYIKTYAKNMTASSGGYGLYTKNGNGNSVINSDYPSLVASPVLTSIGTALGSSGAMASTYRHSLPGYSEDRMTAIQMLSGYDYFFTHSVGGFGVGDVVSTRQSLNYRLLYPADMMVQSSGLYPYGLILKNSTGGVTYRSDQILCGLNSFSNFTTSNWSKSISNSDWVVVTATWVVFYASTSSQNVPAVAGPWAGFTRSGGTLTRNTTGFLLGGDPSPPLTPTYNFGSKNNYLTTIRI